LKGAVLRGESCLLSNSEDWKGEIRGKKSAKKSFRRREKRSERRNLQAIKAGEAKKQRQKVKGRKSWRRRERLRVQFQGSKDQDLLCPKA